MDMIETVTDMTVGVELQRIAPITKRISCIPKEVTLLTINIPTTWEEDSGRHRNYFVR